MFRTPFHLVELSPWPLVGSFAALLITFGITANVHQYTSSSLWLGFVLVLLIMLQWWRDITREGALQGFHTINVSVGLRWGIILFIVSEVCFFFAFFWAYFHSSLVPTIEMGCYWPPTGLIALNPFKAPLLSTAILLSSGISVTWAHHALMESNLKSGLIGLQITVVLGAYFAAFQYLEYCLASFSISDSAFGAVFFVATGFHGFHVIVGAIFLAVCYVRLQRQQFSKNHHFGFEAAAWYWHFVDFVWLFLYLIVYWWGY